MSLRTWTLLVCLGVNTIGATFCNFALQLETDPQRAESGSIFTANASLFRELGISPDTSAAANVGWFLGDAGSNVGPKGQPLCGCAHYNTNGRCYWPNGSRAITTCSLDYWADTPDETISKVQARAQCSIKRIAQYHIITR